MRFVLALALASGLAACGGSSGGGGEPPVLDGSIERDPDAGPPLPGCEEYCNASVATCGGTQVGCLIVCSDVNREKKQRCSEANEALNLCYAANIDVTCDSSVPAVCLDALDRASTCFGGAEADSGG